MPPFLSQNIDTPPSTYHTQIGGSNSTSNPTLRTMPFQINAEFLTENLKRINLNDDIDIRAPRNSKYWV